jgi:phage-related protein
MRWASKKYKRLRPYKRFKTWWSGVLHREPGLFAHWAWVRTFAGLRREERSDGRPSRSVLWEPGVRFPRATRPGSEASRAVRRESASRAGGAGMLEGVARTQAVYYRDDRGVEPVGDFIEELPSKRAAKIDEYIEEHLNGKRSDGPPPEYPISSQIEGELRELRVRFANTRYRILYQRSNNLVVLLHAIEKDTGAVPKADIERAKRRMADFRRRMDAARRVPPRAAGRDAPPRSRRRR